VPHPCRGGLVGDEEQGIAGHCHGDHGTLAHAPRKLMGIFGRVSRFSAFKFEEGEPGEVAEIALFLASPESRLINGAVILADRGWNAY
jgi:NAD(P)-dependent dehydrogenase (short-subunit alcohol dehydrogenase family)